MDVLRTNNEQNANKTVELLVLSGLYLSFLPGSALVGGLVGGIVTLYASLGTQTLAQAWSDVGFTVFVAVSIGSFVFASLCLVIQAIQNANRRVYPDR